MLALFKKHRVTGILATSRPNTGTHALMDAKADGLQVVPFIRPYRVRPDIQTWFKDPVIFDLVQEEFKRGYYRGIGEFHLSGKAADSEWVKKTVDFAVANNLYLHAHADDDAVEILMRHNPQAQIIWAHTGFGLSTDRVAAMLAKYPKLWGELSYRSGITDGGGKLTPEWRALFERYPDRFLLGSDTWVAERWASYGEIMAGYRAWLAQLPPKAASANRPWQCQGAVRRRSARLSSDRKAGAAAAGGGGVRIDHPERGADQIVDEIDLRAGQKRHRGRIDQHHGAVARDHEVVLGLGALDVEFVLKTRAAAALDADAQHGAVALGLEDFPDAAGGPLADGDGCGHVRSSPVSRCHTQIIWYPARPIVKCASPAESNG